MRRLVWASVVVAVLSLTAPAGGGLTGGEVAAQACTMLTNNMVITQSTSFCAGSYSFLDREANGVIIVGADGITIDGNGLTLDGRNKAGYGISVNNRRNVTIRNFTIQRYYYAIRVESSTNIRIENSVVSHNGRKAEQFYDINRPLNFAYGGGILANRTTNSVFTGLAGSDQNVGIELYDSSGNQIVGSNVSDNFGWGIRLYRSTGNTVAGNSADRVHGCRGRFCSARDTAGILLVWESHGNTIAGNSITQGGDGFFIGNQNGLPSNNNLIENNDATGAIHNAFEATFSEGNVFRGNIASQSDYGFWLGFSHHSTVENNTIAGNRTDGIHWEHGRYGTINGNRITSNGRHGLAFTLNPANSLIGRYPGSEASHHHTVAGNILSDNGQRGLYLLHTTDSTIRDNTANGNAVNLFFDGDSVRNAATQNNLACASAAGRVCQFSAYNNMTVGKDVPAENNWWGTTSAGQIAALVFDGRDDPTKGLIDYDPWRQTAP